MNTYIGEPILRIDAKDKVTGKAKYIDDMRFEGMLYCKVKSSDYPHAEIKNIDISKALSVPGVVKIATAKDVPGKNIVTLIYEDQPVIAGDKVRYIGDTVAIVAGESEESAEEACKLIEVEYKELPGIFSIESALDEHSVKIHPQGNILCTQKIRRGNIDEGFKESDIIIERTYETPMVEHIYLETQGAIAVPNFDGSFTIYASAQSPYYVQNAVAKALGISLNRVRVIQSVIGGGFGGKEDVPSEIAARAAVLAYLTNRPVKLVLKRDEDIIMSSKRHHLIMKYKFGAKRDGKLVSAKVEIFGEAGAYGTLTSVVLYRSTIHATGPYIIPNVSVDSVGVYTNHPPAGAFRGFGAPQVAFASERMMDTLANELGIDPLDLRMMNALEVGSRTITDQLLTESVGLKKTMIKARETANWDIKRTENEKARKRKNETVVIQDLSCEKTIDSNQMAVSNENRHSSFVIRQSSIKRGIGCSSFHYGVSLGAKGWALDGSGAYIQLFKDGSFSVAIGGIEMGQGVFTAIAQISAETLKVPIEKINVLQTDTALAPDSGPSVASRTVSMSGNAVIDAGKKLKKEMDRIASEVLSIPIDKVITDNGIWFCKDEPNKKISLETLAMECFRRNAKMCADGWYNAPYLNFDMEQGIGEAYFIYTFGTQIAEVEVDTETGEVKVIQLISVTDVGKTINYQGLTGQVEGSGAQGIGYALMEKFIIDKGKVITPNLATYLIPTAMDVGDIKTIVIEEPYSRGPFGAKGIGEAVLIPVASAIANAVSNAVGIDIKSLPITPEMLFSKNITGF